VDNIFTTCRSGYPVNHFHFFRGGIQYGDSGPWVCPYVNLSIRCNCKTFLHPIEGSAFLPYRLQLAKPNVVFQKPPRLASIQVDISIGMLEKQQGICFSKHLKVNFRKLPCLDIHADQFVFLGIRKRSPSDGSRYLVSCQKFDCQRRSDGFTDLFKDISLLSESRTY